MKKNQKGFSAVEGVLILVAVAIVGFTGWYVYSANKNTNRTYDAADKSSQNSAKVNHTKQVRTTNKSTSSTSALTPQAFTVTVLAAISNNDETKLESLLSPAYKTFRNTSFNTYPCGGNNKNPVTLFCGSILNSDTATKLAKLTPSVTGISYKNGTKGEQVNYQQANSGEPGTNYFSFKLLAHGNSWQVNDYGDVFVSQGDHPPTKIGGIRNQ